jgi:MoaA/NifB/PqqE/SkfB family radical SAM enzyme
MLGGINYKNGVISTCPRQADQLVYQHETYLPSELFNHSNFKRAREKLYNDEFPAGCSTCKEMEDINNKSMRLDFALDKQNNFYRPVMTTDGTIDYSRGDYEEGLMKCYDPLTHETTFEGLRHLEFRFSSACNFACLHCSEVFSSGWTAKLKKYEPDEEDKFLDIRQLLGTEHRHGPNDKNEMGLTTEQSLEICEDLIENFPNLRWIDFAGGELLYQKQFFPTLRKLAEHPNAKNMHISFHTNFNAKFSVEELSAVLEPFGESAIIISVDAGRSFYSYFRYGGKWEQLVKNIKEFKLINNYTYMTVTCTASIYQMLDIYDVMDSFLELDCEFDASLVQSPKYLDPSLIFLEFEKETNKDLERTEQLLQKHKQYKSLYWFKYIVDYAKNYKPVYRDYMRWLVYRRKSDMLWNQHFNDYFKNYKINEQNDLIRVNDGN